jgi:lysophospholipase L1-like esterase
MTSQNEVDRRDVLKKGVLSVCGAGVATTTALPAAVAGADQELEPLAASLPKIDRHSHEFRKMVALGESTTAGGWSSSRERCWVPLLAGLINDLQAEPMEVVNSGIGANVVSTRSPCYEHSGKPAANERLQKHVIDHQPDLLIISYGLNDARGGTPLDLFTEELAGVIGHVRRHVQPVILLPGPYFMTDFRVGGENWSHANLETFGAYNEATREVAREQDCLFVDLLSAYQETRWMIHYDGVHANDLGHRIVANRMFEVIAQNCSGVARKTQALEKTSPRWRDESTLKAEYGF